jgi:sec-independent protein translocase protein TatB
MGIESPVHLLFIAVVALIVLGPKRLPELARAVGKGVREFRGAMEAARDEQPDDDEPDDFEPDDEPDEVEAHGEQTPPARVHASPTHQGTSPAPAPAQPPKQAPPAPQQPAPADEHAQPADEQTPPADTQALS